MTPTNYDRHFKVLGKLARMFDQAEPDVSNLELLITRLYDQVATGGEESLPGVLALDGFANQFANGVSATGQGYRQSSLSAAIGYLKNSDFVDDLTTATTANDAPRILNALATDMSAAVDNVTLSDEAATGFVHFFKALGATAAWNTEADATADYKDSVYVVDAII